jgi:hypothetical protein
VLFELLPKIILERMYKTERTAKNPKNTGFFPFEESKQMMIVLCWNGVTSLPTPIHTVDEPILGRKEEYVPCTE